MTEKQFTCVACGTTGSLEWMRDHPCDEVQDVTRFGGRCEDYPCCGHLPGECMPSETFTKAYWEKRMAEDEDYDYAEE
jgi:hypothetical protein